MTYPEPFLERMRQLLGPEFADFERALYGPRVNSLRVNTLKLEPSALEPLLQTPLRPVPWCDAGFYVSYEARAGSHALHAAGAYYVQEASAMAVGAGIVGILGRDGLKNLKVLDLCAAPGGKSTHLGQLMNNTGLLVSNEIVTPRAKILAENLERLGIRATVMNEDPGRLSRAWGAYFDVVLVDAPCSGEGMFRKNSEAALEWSLDLPATCARRQDDILEAASNLLKPGGLLMYSTCTFAPEENEGVVSEFLEQHPEFELLELSGFAPGRPEWAGQGSSAQLTRTARLWPHLLEGEGHFMAAFQKIEGEESETRLERGVSLDKPLQKLWTEFAQTYLLEEEAVTLFKGEIQALNPLTPSLERLKVIRAGVPLAELKTSRLEPQHGLSHLYPRDANLPALNLALDDPRVAVYLRGESLEVESSEAPEGWILVRVAGLALGWGKKVRGTVKNHLSKHLRS